MGAYIAKRVLLLVPMTLGVLTLTFVLMYILPGDPLKVVLQLGAADPKTIEAMRKTLGLDLPLHMQYLRYLERLLHGDMGSSLLSQRLVFQEVMERFPNTLMLALPSLMVSLLVGLPTGVIAAARRGTFVDGVSTVGALMFVSMPVFWTGLVLMLLFSLHLGWLPALGMGSLQEGLWAAISHFILPAFTLGSHLSGSIMRMTRSSMLEVLGQDYVRTARAKGLGERVVVYRHALKNAALPIVTVTGMLFGYLLGGSVITETIFAWPGMGSLTIEAMLARDYPLVQGCILVFAVCVMITNLAVDLLYASLDPRIRYQ